MHGNALSDNNNNDSNNKSENVNNDSNNIDHDDSTIYAKSLKCVHDSNNSINK